MAHLACLRRNQRRRFGHADRLRHRPRPKRDVQLELLVRVQKDSLLLELRESLQLCRHRIAADRKQVKGVAALGVAGHRPGGAGGLFGDRDLRARHHRAARIEHGARYASLRALREQCGSDRKGNKQSDKKHAGSAIHDAPSSDLRSPAPDAKANKEQLKLKAKTSTRADASGGGYTRPAQYVKHAYRVPWPGTGGRDESDPPRGRRCRRGISFIGRCTALRTSSPEARDTPFVASPF